MMILVELFQAILVHLDGRDKLLLLNVDMCNIQPNVTEIGGRFANLSEQYAGLVDVAFMREDGTDAVGSPDILGIVPHDLFIHGQRTFLKRPNP